MVQGAGGGGEEGKREGGGGEEGKRGGGGGKEEIKREDQGRR